MSEPDAPSVTAQMDQDDISTAGLDAPEETTYQLLQRVELLESSLADRDATIADLNRRLAKCDPVSSYPTDDELRRELADLFHDMNKWTLHTTEKMRCGIVVSIQDETAYDWLDWRMPWLEDRECFYARYALITVIAYIFLGTEQIDGAIEPDLSYFGLAFQRVSGALFSWLSSPSLNIDLPVTGPDRYAEFQIWQDLTRKLLLSIDPDALKKNKRRYAKSLCIKLRQTLGAITSLQPNERVMQSIFAIACSAVDILAKLSLHPAQYKFFYELEPDEIGGGQGIYHVCSGPTDGSIAGWVFPGLVKIRDEAGKMIPTTIISKAMIITEPIEPIWHDVPQTYNDMNPDMSDMGSDMSVLDPNLSDDLDPRDCFSHN